MSRTVETIASRRMPCRGRQTANTLESNKRCEKAETECEDSLEKEQLVRLPSTGRFEDRFSHCQAAFDRVCIGPAHTGQVHHQASSSPISCVACLSAVLPVYQLYCLSIVFACLSCLPVSRVCLSISCVACLSCLPVSRVCLSVVFACLSCLPVYCVESAR